MSALVSKPAISLSPMFVVAILNSYGYSDLKDKTMGATPELKYIMFILVCCFPIIIGTIQLIAWSFFDIQHKSELRINVI
jgi:Na+/melibiose symporter-like transporter